MPAFHYCPQLLDLCLPALTFYGIADLVAGFWVRKPGFDLFDKIRVIDTNSYVLQNTNLRYIGRYNRQSGGEIFADLQRIRRKSQLIDGKWVESDIETLAIRRKVGIRLAAEEMNVWQI